MKLGLGSCLLAPIFLAIVWLDAAFIDKDAQIQKHIWSYAAVIWMSLIIIPVYTTLMTVMRAAAMGGPATFASLIALVINFCITPILVFGWFGAPELGVAGGALGAVFAQLATLVLCVFFIIRQRPDLLPARWPLPAIDHTLYRRIYGSMSGDTSAPHKILCRGYVASAGLNCRICWTECQPVL